MNKRDVGSPDNLNRNGRKASLCAFTCDIQLYTFLPEFGLSLQEHSSEIDSLTSVGNRHIVVNNGLRFRSDSNLFSDFGNNICFLNRWLCYVNRFCTSVSRCIDCHFGCGNLIFGSLLLLLVFLFLGILLILFLGFLFRVLFDLDFNILLLGFILRLLVLRLFLLGIIILGFVIAIRFVLVVGFLFRVLFDLDFNILLLGVVVGFIIVSFLELRWHIATLIFTSILFLCFRSRDCRCAIPTDIVGLRHDGIGNAHSSISLFLEVGVFELHNSDVHLVHECGDAGES